MPGFLSGYNQVTRINIDPEGKWWIDVKDHLSRRDTAIATTALVKPIVRYEDGDSQTQGNVDTVSYQMELVIAGIVDWNLTDEEDVLLPLDPPDAKRESINRLPNDVFTIVAGHIQGVPRPASDAQFPKGTVGRADSRKHAAAGANRLPD
jgi:hypothetical protein